MWKRRKLHEESFIFQEGRRIMSVRLTLIVVMMIIIMNIPCHVMKTNIR
jgi:hypothetical protein